ncbi:MAG: hypothetical protein BWX84_01207 [Verrucomicrobia bacterium ADurb.Bin118]|nr:MAG: hypothetical protein BWX84_01207 [Verrucomicrobia bacterium ADurb.Bin118]
MFGEKLVGARNGIASKFLLADGVDLIARRHGLDHLPPGIARFDNVTRQQPHQPALMIHHREGVETVFAFLHQRHDVADQLFRRHLDGLLDHAGHVKLHAADLGELLALGHVVMNEPQASVQRHRNRHVRFGDRIHVGGHDGDVQGQPLGKAGVELRVAGKHLGILRGQGDVVIRQGQRCVRGKEIIGGLVKPGVQRMGFLRCCHVGKCSRPGVLGKLNSGDFELAFFRRGHKLAS